MSFTTKKYTLNLLLTEVSSLSRSSFSNVSSLAVALSPRAGRSSAKINALNSFLNGSLTTVLRSSSLGKTPRGRLLRALRNRKRNGNA